MGILVGAALVALAAVLFIIQPLVKGLHASLDREDDELTETEARKRVALLALRDVEYDFLAGKLDDADYRSLKGELTAEALAALEADEAAQERREAGILGPPALEAEIARARARMAEGILVCRSCAFGNEEGSRYCSACGKALVSQAAG
ncbi:MAG: hypothetical protein RH859_01270 [Longimicrobiales bacterium]